MTRNRMKPERKNVAFIGLGGMGIGMAGNLLRAGLDLVACNRTPAKAEPLLAAGARFAATPGEAATGADMIISMVGDDGDSQAVWLGEDGVLAGNPKANSIAVECSTLSLAWIRELHQACHEAGLRFIDCPVTGGRAGAEAGTLTLLVGADEESLQQARPLLEGMSKRLIHFGAVGSATAYKLVVNLMVGVQAAALAKGVALAQNAGLEMSLVLEGLTSGAAASPVVKAYAARMAAGEHEQPVQFVLEWVHKDLVYARRMAQELGQMAPTLAAATDLFARSVAQSGPQKNVTAVIESLR
jgi:3-hydroxyisobutyrate dehydrogenase